MTTGGILVLGIVSDTAPAPFQISLLPLTLIPATAMTTNSAQILTQFLEMHTFPSALGLLCWCHRVRHHRNLLSATLYTTQEYGQFVPGGEPLTNQWWEPMEKCFSLSSSGEMVLRCVSEGFWEDPMQWWPPWERFLVSVLLLSLFAAPKLCFQEKHSPKKYLHIKKWGEWVTILKKSRLVLEASGLKLAVP